MKHANLILMLGLSCLNNLGQANQPPSAPLATGTNSSEQIGNSYFKSVLTKPISQVGSAFEARQESATLYGFFNQLTTNHIFYEVRAYGIYNYLANTPLVSPTVQASHQQNSLGYGGAGILGYNINLNSNLSLLPFARAQVLTNTFGPYADSLGNQLGSVDYGGSIGTKLSQRMTDVFALYTLGFMGYQWSLISGNGLLASKHQASAGLYFAGFEFGAPCKIVQKVSITPYAQLFIANINPNQAALDLADPVNQTTELSGTFGVKVGYEF